MKKEAKRELIVDSFTINDESDCWVIAEIGHNHQGNLEKCKELFRSAKECGVNAVKLQKRDNRTLFTKELYDAPYVNENSFGSTYGEHREALEFNWDQYKELQAYAKELGLTFFATAFDIKSADFLEKLGSPAYKIASGDLTNIPLIKHVAKFQKPVFISTGGGRMEDVRRVYDTFMPINPRLSLLQCTAGYPPAYEELNLRVIETFRKEFPDIVIGYSSHDSGIAMDVVSYMLGSRVIEKHFTLNRALKGTDHSFSLEHSGLRKLVRDLRRCRIALGDGVKAQYPSEQKPLYKMGKKLVAARPIAAGAVITAEDIAVKSPNDGMPPYEIDRFIGRRTVKALAQDATLTLDVLAEDSHARLAKINS